MLYWISNCRSNKISKLLLRHYHTLNGSTNLSYNPNVAVQTIPDFISPAVYGVLSENNVKNGNGDPIVAPKDFGFFSVGFGAKYSLNAGIDFNQILFDGQVFVGLQAKSCNKKCGTGSRCHQRTNQSKCL